MRERRGDDRLRHSLRPRIFRGVIAALAVAGNLTCGDGTTEPPVEPNRTPEPVGTIPPQEVAHGDSASVNLSGYFRDPDGDTLSFAATSSDPGIAAAAVLGSVVTVRAASRGTATITVTATDPGGLSTRQAFDATVPNRGPEAVGAIADRQLEVGDSVTLGVAAHFSDPEGDSLTFAATSSDTSVVGAEVKADSVRLAARAKGTATVTVTATDPAGEAAARSFTVTVPNRAPFVTDTIPADTILLGDTVELDLTGHFADPDADELSFSALSSAPGVATARTSGATLFLVPMAPGQTTVTVTATDPEGLSVAQEFDVTAMHPNRAPVAEGVIANRVIHVGSTDSLDVSAHFSDPDGDSLSYTATTSRRIRVTVAVDGSNIVLTAVSLGNSAITITARDPDGLSATQRFRAVVEPVPTPDLVVDSATASADSVQVGGEFTLTAAVRNQGNADAHSPNVLRFYQSFDARITAGDWEVATDSLPALVAAESREASVRLTGPPVAGTRFYGACIDAPANETETDNNCSAGVPVRFWQPNRAPQPRDSIRAQTLEPGGTFSTAVTRFFADADGDSLHFAAASSDNAVATASISGNTLTVEAAAPGQATITVTARDVTTRPPGSFTATQRFEVTVRLRPRPDLVVEMTQDSFTVAPQERFILNALVRNRGTRDVPSGTTVRFYLSSDKTIGTDDTEIATATAGALPLSGRQTVSVGVTSPPDVGVYYYGACVDAVDEESGTDNNCSGALTVAVDEEEPPNRPPQVLKTFRDVTDTIPERRYRGPLEGVFGDPDGDPLQITAESSDDGVARAEIVGDSIYVYTFDFGTAIITVTATDPGGLSASTEFAVMIAAPTPSSGFSIASGFTSTVTDAQRTLMRAAEVQWEAILAATDLPDVAIPAGFDCRGLTLTDTITADHVFMSHVGSVDGPGGTLAVASICARRTGSGAFPVVSIAVFDAADIDRIVGAGSLFDLAFHELAHGLGFVSTSFARNGLLATGSDPHFTGPGARAAFDAAGGGSYTGARVPLSPDLSHWREEVFDVEVMTPRLEVGVPQPVSVILLAAMGDLGYTVDIGLADDYTLPGPRPPIADRVHPGPAFDLSGDVVHGPVVILGTDGSVADIIPAPPRYAAPALSGHRVTIDLRSPAAASTLPGADPSLYVSWIREPWPASRRRDAPTRLPR